jgi:hypothetical protein
MVLTDERQEEILCGFALEGKKAMTEDQKDQKSIPESLADEPTRQKLAKAGKQIRANLARKLKVSRETIRRSEKRADLYLSTMREYAERKGGALYLKVEFPGRPPVILAGMGGNSTEDKLEKKAKKKAGTSAKSKPQTRRAA